MSATQNPPALNTTSDAAISHSKYVADEKKFRAKLATRPDSAQYREWLRQLNLLLPEEQASALLEQEQAIEAGTEPDRGYRAWGNALAQQERYDEAIEKLKRAALLNPSRSGIYKDWGDVLFRQVRFDEAERLYRKAIGTEPKQAWYGPWGKALDKLTKEQQDAAVESLRQLFDDNAQYVLGYVYLGRLLSERNRRQEAIQTFQKAVSLNPELPITYWYWGDAALSAKEYEEAEKLYRKSLECSSSPEDFDDEFGDWITALEQLRPDHRQMAIQDMETIMASKPEAADAYASWADVLETRGRFAEAVAKLELAAKLDAKKTAGLATVYLAWGRSLARSHNYAEAIDKYRKAIRSGEGSEQEAYVAWAEALYGQRQYGPAQRVYIWATQAGDGDAGDPEMLAQAFEGWAKALYLERSYAEAVQKLTKSLELRPTLERFRLWAHTFARLAAGAQKVILSRSQADMIPLLPRWVGAFKRSSTSVHDSLESLTKRLRDNFDGFENKNEASTAYVCWGQMLGERGDHSGAIQNFRRALELDGENVAAIENWGDELRKQRQYQDATEKYKELDRLEDPSATALMHHKLGLINLDCKDWTGVISNCEQAMDHQPDDKASVYALWGDAYFSLEQFLLAEERYRQAIKENPGNVLVSYYCYIWRNAVEKLNTADQEHAFAEMQLVFNGDCSSEASPTAWADTLAASNRLEAAGDEYRKILATNPLSKDAHFNYGNLLTDQRCYEDGLAEYEKAIDVDPNFDFAYHNIAHYLTKRGSYSAAQAFWEKARKAYEHTAPDAIMTRDSYTFYARAALLSEISGDLEKAQEVLQEALEFNPEDTAVLTSLGDVLLDRSLEGLEEPALANARAHEYYRIAVPLLQQQVERTHDAELCVRLGDLLMKTNNFVEAEKWLLKALGSKQPAVVSMQLGVLNARKAVQSSRKEDLMAAAQFFEGALESDPDDLNLRSNLAETYLKLDFLEKAESEYESILKIAPGQIDSQIGLGHLYAKIGETGDPDMYDHAIQHFSEAIDLAETSKGSKRLGKADLAAVYYSRGYARVRLYEKSKSLPEERQLSDALEDFTRCYCLNRSQHKALRAMEKLGKRTRWLTPQSMIERCGPWFIVTSSICVFLLIQMAFWMSKPPFGLRSTDNASLYASMTLSSLALAVVGVYLPKILKLKVAGIEIEKSTVDQISVTRQPLDIGK
jgi:tetratricopeptide (TPR) repeat protein